ncbi:hypothetical protein ONZ45_g4722 [Pleurotus djamor]|nr:hypothetical protein ONZ45_g4722 [Pleurotus djamor]
MSASESSITSPQAFVIILPQSLINPDETHAAKSNGPEMPVIVAKMDEVIPPIWIAQPQADKSSVAIVDPQTGLYWTYDLNETPVKLSSQFVPSVWTVNKLDSHRIQLLADYGEPDGEKLYAFNNNGEVGLSKEPFEWLVDWSPVPAGGI